MRIRKPKGQRKTTCSGCGKQSRPGQRYCLECHAKYMRENRPTYSALNPQARKKANTRAYANSYLKRGHIQKQPCEVCGNENSQMHHEDYNKPLVVKWLCRKHHLEIHPPKRKAVTY